MDDAVQDDRAADVDDTHDKGRPHQERHRGHVRVGSKGLDQGHIRRTPARLWLDPTSVVLEEAFFERGQDQREGVGK